MYKKVYVEITNTCNLNCSFCIKNKRDNKIMSMDEFKIILNKLNGITKYLYLHVLGEPLMHPNINEFIDEATKNYYVNITTNGYLIKKIINSKNIRQINISLHSFDSKYNNSLDDYLNDIFEVTDKLKNNTYINYRIWVNSPYNNEIIKKLENKYQVKITSNMRLSHNTFIDFDEAFIWPYLENNLNNENGKCYGLIDHFGILANGTIIPCCLDSKGDINLGNIFTDNIKEVLKSNRVKDMVNGFKNNNRCENLCKHCGFNLKYK